MRVAAAENLRILSKNWLTSWRTVPQLRHRYTAVDTIALQQQLGHIYDSELAEVNRVLGGSKRFFKSNSSELYTVDSLASTILLGGGMAFAFIGIVTLRSNLLWAGAGVLPCLLHLNFSSSRQDEDLVQNAYRYLLAKRAAISEFEANKGQVAAHAGLRQQLIESHRTLYEMEHAVVDKICSGQF